MTYITMGSVRGQCAHNHRTIKGAVKCLARDNRGCKSQGGYSDREVYRYDGTTLNEREYSERDELRTTADSPAYTWKTCLCTKGFNNEH